MTYKKKLIEVALPLEAINTESLRRKQKAPKGFPTSFHKWWAQRPLAACRAVLFGSLVDDPNDEQANPAFVEACKQLPVGPNATLLDTPRMRLFDFIEKLVLWENSNNDQVLGKARELINLATDGNPPAVLDPFCGGGSIPLEAQRLSLKVYASDLNPVAVLITKALIEIPPIFAGQPPVNPDWQRKDHNEKAAKLWHGAEGLAEDVRYYGQWMRDEAEKRIGLYYPKAKLPDGNTATAIAWLWARTVKCPNPVCGCQMPLARSFELSRKEGKETWAQPVVEQGNPPAIRFVVSTGKGPRPEGTVNRKGASCIACGTAVPFAYIRAEGKAGNLGAQLMAIVAEGERERGYLEPNAEHIRAAVQVQPEWDRIPDTDLPAKALGFRTQEYGMVKHRHLFTNRQLMALLAFSDLVGEARAKAQVDASAAGLLFGPAELACDGSDAQAYGDSISTYLALAIDRVAYYGSSLATWLPKDNAIRDSISRQALPMVWDYAEANPFGKSSGDYMTCIDVVANYLRIAAPNASSRVLQEDARVKQPLTNNVIVCTDPPYYDNIGYADLSDYFYIWLRQALKDIFPDMFATILVPKTPELVATPYRFGGNREDAKRFFENGLGCSFNVMRTSQHSEYPLTVFYAFKQAESDADNVDANGNQATASTGWETMLEALMRSRFQITGTLPFRSEGASRLVAKGTNALASSIVLVCRPRPDDATVTTRKDLTRQMEQELPKALRELQEANIAPVDFAQAAIGPGMAVYSRFSKVLEPSGERMGVRAALVLINQMLDEHLSQQEGDYDNETRWALAWFEQNGHKPGSFGVAELLSKAKNVSLDRLVEAGILEKKAGKVRLLERHEYNYDGWDPLKDKHLPAWEIMQRLIHVQQQGDEKAAIIMQAVGGLADTAKELAYRLYNLCERKGWAKEAQAYNQLVVSWQHIVSAKNKTFGEEDRQPGLFAG